MDKISTFSYTPADLSLMPTRSQDSNKSTFGRLLCVCGSKGMAGAAYLAAKAAMRTGVGLVEIATPEENRAILQTLLPEAIVTTYNSDSLASLTSALSRADTVVCGCGLSVTAESRAVLATVMRNASVPLVLDADALNLLSRNHTLFKYAKGAIVTPHPLEMSRLTGLSLDEIQANRDGICQSFATDRELICVLKGHRTLVSDGGKQIYLNRSGNSGMATAGSGDVLAGIIGAILAQARGSSLTRMQIASLGVYIHGLAGEDAARRLGEYSVMASDIIDSLPSVLKAIH